MTLPSIGEYFSIGVPDPNHSPAKTPRLCTFRPSLGKISAAVFLTFVLMQGVVNREWTQTNANLAPKRNFDSPPFALIRGYLHSPYTRPPHCVPRKSFSGTDSCLTNPGPSLPRAKSSSTPVTPAAVVSWIALSFRPCTVPPCIFLMKLRCLRLPPFSLPTTLT